MTRRGAVCIGALAAVLAATTAADARVRPFASGIERGTELADEPSSLPGVRAGLDIVGIARIAVSVVATPERFASPDGPGDVRMDVLGYGGVVVEQTLMRTAEVDVSVEAMVGGALRCQRDAPVGEGLCPRAEAVAVLETGANVRWRPTDDVELGAWFGYRTSLGGESEEVVDVGWAGHELVGFSARFSLSLRTF